MSDLAGVGKAVFDMRRDLDKLGECRKLLASPGLAEAMRDLIKEQALNVGKSDPFLEGILYFKGTPVVECEHLQDLEYAFVK